MSGRDVLASVHRFAFGASGSRRGRAAPPTSDASNQIRPHLTSPEQALPASWQMTMMLDAMQVGVVAPAFADPPALADELSAERRRRNQRRAA